MIWDGRRIEDEEKNKLMSSVIGGAFAETGNTGGRITWRRRERY